MSETLRDLVVSLSLNSDNFTRNVKSINKQIQEAESAFRLASAGVENFETTTAGLSSKLSTLQRTFQLQQDAETALNNARAAVKQTQSDIASCNKELKTAQSEWTKAGKSLESFGKSCDSISKNLNKAGKLLSTTLTTPIVALGTAAIKSSIDFESSFTSARKTVDATEAEFEQLAATSKKMSTEVAAGTDEINEVMASGGQLGVATEHLSDFTRVMIDLGNSCEDLSADEAATTIAQFANIMGTSQSQFSNIGSTLVDLGNNFATTEKPIMEMAHRMAGAGKQVGLTEAQVLGFAAALSSVGIEAQMGGSAFSKALVKMEVASATGGEALDDFGKVAGMTAQQFKTLWDNDPAAAFQAFIVGLSKLDDEGESAIKTLSDIGIKEVRLRDIMLRAVIASYLKGSGKVAFANRPGGFYFARIVNQIPFEKILRGNPHRSFAVNFRCKPFWYQENVPEITVTTSGTFITNPGSVFSEPVITVYGSGEITLMVGMTIVELDGITDSITLDTPLMEAYKDTTSMNSCMSGDFPTLLPGQNAISWTGNVTKVVIQPNWRYL